MYPILPQPKMTEFQPRKPNSSRVYQIPATHLSKLHQKQPQTEKQHKIRMNNTLIYLLAEKYK